MSIGDWRDAVTPLAQQHTENDSKYGDLHPNRSTLAGNYKDDDAETFAEFTQEHTDAMAAKLPSMEPTRQPSKTPDPHTRIIGGTLILNSGTSTGGNVAPQITTPSDVPVQILPADANRKGFGMRCNALGVGGTGTGLGSDEVCWGSSRADVINRMTRTSIATSTTINNDLHTGPVWVFAPETNNNGAGGSMFLTYYAITF